MIKALDSFRFYAFLAVFLFHVKLFDGGYLGVQAFFVLSGFLLTPILVDMKSRMPFKSFMFSFYGRRMLRIFPLYYFYLIATGILAGIAVFALGQRPSPAIAYLREQWLYAATYLYDFFYASAAFRETPLLSHFWSLAVEEQFYLVWPLFIWLAPKEKLNRYLCGIALAGPVVRFATYLVYLRFDVSGFIQDPTRAVYGLPFSHFDAFAIGGLLALVRGEQWRRAAWPLALATCCAGLGTQYFVAGHVGWKSMGYPPFMSGEWKLVWGYSLLNLTFAGILRAVKTQSFLPPLFSFPPIQYLGKISYGLYVYHFPVIWLLQRGGSGSRPSLPLDAAMLAATVAVSALSYELFEKKFIALKDKWFSKGEKPPPRVSPAPGSA